VIEAEFVLGGFETVLDGPAMSFDQYQLLHGRVLGYRSRRQAARRSELSRSDLVLWPGASLSAMRRNVRS
jgi:hypothetical protein